MQKRDRGLHLFSTRNEEGWDLVYICPASGDYLLAYGHVINGADVVLRMPHPDGRPDVMDSKPSTRTQPPITQCGPRGPKPGWPHYRWSPMSALVGAVRDAALTAGATRLSLATETNDEAALGLYRRLGFRSVEGPTSLSLGLGLG